MKRVAWRRGAPPVYAGVLRMTRVLPEATSRWLNELAGKEDDAERKRLWRLAKLVASVELAWTHEHATVEEVRQGVHERVDSWKAGHHKTLYPVPRDLLYKVSERTLRVYRRGMEQVNKEKRKNPDGAADRLEEELQRQMEYGLDIWLARGDVLIDERLTRLRKKYSVPSGQDLPDEAWREMKAEDAADSEKRMRDMDEVNTRLRFLSDEYRKLLRKNPSK